MADTIHRMEGEADMEAIMLDTDTGLSKMDIANMENLGKFIKMTNSYLTKGNHGHGKHGHWGNHGHGGWHKHGANKHGSHWGKHGAGHNKGHWGNWGNKLHRV
ncbi:unnamed protein product [Oppiella nova]|uniref:Uncharacterized protein n=1 Tax=Oppiella nova TaxID=334625 RepID=A0A7R9QZF0_9ACAR|nr:unnamed protein product [Oppiella nova]CAG2179790.1 unnamed protein product [Oppiella nova]